MTVTLQPALEKYISARIAYWGRDNTLIGRESFSLASHAQGYSFRAFCEMDDIALLRDVTMSLDRNWSPIDGFCRITTAGQVVAANWFSFNNDQVVVETDLKGKERISQKFENQPAYCYLGLHPLQGDALVTTQVDKSKPGEYVAVHGLTNSLSENGDQGLTATPVTIEVAYLGNQKLTVAAGQFDARKYALRWQPDWPPAYVWVKEGDYIFLKMTWQKIDNWYELIELTERNSV
ncbi:MULTISPECIES: hypothetical protein [Aliiglaciecola]|uniref:hypothetical protein n=1 Tax=Aliiglaciecola TaxID=1406885 RepID=UPI001C092E68|nr:MULTISPECIES: hypothetical protein [Aliiglaciecola]MBU2879004.1 hypothetical protein [Aliiglaciecola lipolytica]MDO6710702.1 hypothetical protein [Aliiglaciecola sp. 2_MG-2023]MDO6751890.1 hypothetical protein [Aliiglaciecola sp. 1_MG-2023]